MITDNQIIEEALSWTGTRWMHGQGVKGGGTDCIQFIIKLAKQFEWVPQSYEPPKYRIDYAMWNDESIMLREVAKFCDKIDNLRLAEVGDILIFKTVRCAAHAGIYIGPDRMVEARVRGGVQSASIENSNGFHSVWRAKNR